MTRPRWIYLVILLLLGVAWQAHAATTPMLQHIAKLDEFDQSRIVLDFSTLPEHRLETSGQRIDLLLKNTDVADALNTLPEDDKVVKILLARKPQELLVSILLHKIPARVTAMESPSTRQLTLDIRWHANGARRPAIAFQLSGMPTAHPSLPGIASPRLTSVYAGRWKDFFKTYRTPVTLQPPVHPTLAAPPFPDVKGTPAERDLRRLAVRGQWRELLAQTDAAAARQKSDTVALLKAEALLQTGQTEQALQLFRDQLSAAPPASHADRARYHCALAEALSGDPYQARCTLAALLADDKKSSLAPYIRLLEGELLLATGRPAQARNIFDTPLRRWPRALQPAVRWRRAEIFALEGEMERAEGRFRKLFNRGATAHANDPDLLYLAGRACLETGRYAQAQAHFQTLEDKITDPVARGNVQFLTAYAGYLGGESKQSLATLQQLCFDYEEQEPAYRAWMALLDHRFLQLKAGSAAQIAVDYGTVASQAPVRQLREEAAFKQVLAYYLENQHERAADLLQDFLRNFAHGPLHHEGEALAAEFLPTLIRDLISKGEDMKAAVLVESNRELLINSNLAWTFLPDLAQAYTRMGLWDKACKSYFFLIDQGKDANRQAQHYLPLVQLLYDRGRYAMAASFAQRYLKTFPAGAHRAEQFLLQLQALEKCGRLDEAAMLIAQGGHPDNAAIALQSARIYWHLEKTAEIMALPASLDASAEGKMLRAEALRLNAQERKALSLYEQLQPVDAYAAQAAYRCAEIRLKTGDTETALKLFGRLAETKPATPWGLLARDALARQDMKRTSLP